MSSANGGIRRRGVRASRAKLAHALTEAGLKTQAALAERMADIEQLDVAPKDVVSRVFRELPVDATTLERVARALGVEAYTLYKTADEEPIAGSPGTEPVRDAGDTPLHHVVYGASIVVAIAVVVVTWMRLTGSATPASESSEAIALDMGSSTLAVIPFPNDPDNAFATSLRQQLADVFTIARPTADALTRTRDAAAVAERLRTDVVVDGEILRVGRLIAVRAYLYRGGVRRQIWADSVPSAALRQQVPSLAAATALAVRQAVGFPVPGAIGHFPLASAQDEYLEGELLLDAPSNELNVKRAQSRFEAALRQDANYARAHAGLCQTLLEEHWMDSEERALNDASLACGQAVQLDPNDRVVAAAHARFLARTGRNDEAIAVYRDIVATHPADAAALSGLSASLLEAYRASGDTSELEEAKRAAGRAAEVDGSVWKPLFSLATMHWFAGDVAAAIEASEAALDRDENEYILANLGSFYLCDGAIDAAVDAYTRARDLNPSSYVGDEFLGQAYYFQGAFERSAELRRRAIDSVANGNPEIHEMWGNLGDSYRQAGDPARAIDAYLRAAEIAERDYLRGTAPVADQAARAYYYTMLASLDPQRVPQSVTRSIDDDIDRIAASLVSATALRRMAQTYFARGDSVKAIETLARATESCAGYALLPDLAPIASSLPSGASTP